MMARGKPLQVLAPARPCGGCTACCTALFVPEIEKQPLVACGDVGAGGCGIYEDRPASCRAFECAWRFEVEALGLGDEDRPDRSGVVLYLVNPAFGGMTAHAAWPSATQSGPGKALIERLAERGISFAVIEGVNVEGVYVPMADHPLLRRVEALLQKGEACSPAT